MDSSITQSAVACELLKCKTCAISLLNPVYMRNNPNTASHHPIPHIHSMEFCQELPESALVDDIKWSWNTDEKFDTGCYNFYITIKFRLSNENPKPHYIISDNYSVKKVRKICEKYGLQIPYRPKGGWCTIA